MRGVVGSSCDQRGDGGFLARGRGRHGRSSAPHAHRRAGDGLAASSTSPGIEDLLGRGVYYGAGRSEALQCRDDPRRRRRRRQLGGPGVMHLADVRAERHGARPRRLAAEVDVGLPRRPHRGEHAIDVRCGPRSSPSRPPDGQLDSRRQRGGERIEARALFLCLGGVPRPLGPGARTYGSTSRASSSPAPTCSSTAAAPTTGRSTATRFALETSVPGLFAAGDVRHGSTKRCGAARRARARWRRRSSTAASPSSAADTA